MHVHDASSERKTAENLLAVIAKVRTMLEETWGVFVIAVTSDASGESRKARQLCARENPELMIPDCYAHQVSIVLLSR